MNVLLDVVHIFKWEIKLNSEKLNQRTLFVSDLRENHILFNFRQLILTRKRSDSFSRNNNLE